MSDVHCHYVYWYHVKNPTKKDKYVNIKENSKCKESCKKQVESRALRAIYAVI